MRTGRRGDVDRLIDVRWFSSSTLVAGGHAEQIFFGFNHISNGVFQVQNTSSYLWKERLVVFGLFLGWGGGSILCP